MYGITLLHQILPCSNISKLIYHHLDPTHEEAKITESFVRQTFQFEVIGKKDEKPVLFEAQIPAAAWTFPQQNDVLLH